MDSRERDEVLRLHSERYEAVEAALGRLVAYLEYECRGLSEQDEDFHHRMIEGPS